MTPEAICEAFKGSFVDGPVLPPDSEPLWPWPPPKPKPLHVEPKRRRPAPGGLSVLRGRFAVVSDPRELGPDDLPQFRTGLFLTHGVRLADAAGFVAALFDPVLIGDTAHLRQGTQVNSTLRYLGMSPGGVRVAILDAAHPSF